MSEEDAVSGAGDIISSASGSASNSAFVYTKTVSSVEVQKRFLTLVFSMHFLISLTLSLI